MQTTEFQVIGMHCPSCSRNVEESLTDLPGVQEAKVNLAAGTVRLVFDPQQAPFDTLEKTVREAGFTLKADGQVPSNL